MQTLGSPQILNLPAIHRQAQSLQNTDDTECSRVPQLYYRWTPMTS